MTKEEAIKTVISLDPESIGNLTIKECDAMHIVLQMMQDEVLKKTPTDLNEAAYEYASDLSSYIGNGISIARESREDLRDAFKAGAEWMAKQREINNNLQAEKRLLIQDLCARLPYGVKCFAEDSEYGNTGTLYSVDPLEKTDPNIHIQYYSGNIISFFTSEVKPYLRPMSSMTEEELKCFQAFHCVYELHPHFFQQMCNLDNETAMFEWLNKNMFDYRGLIPMGLALEAKEGMYD